MRLCALPKDATIQISINFLFSKPFGFRQDIFFMSLLTTFQKLYAKFSNNITITITINRIRQE